MSQYFKNLNPGVKVHRYMKPTVDLTQLPSDKTCKKLYLEGFSHIGILPAAVEIFKGCPELVLKRLIAQKKAEKKPNEVKILQSILKPKASTQKTTRKSTIRKTQKKS